MSKGNPCPSCPFRETNFEEFGAVAKRLCAKLGLPEPDFWQCATIRKRVVDEAVETGRLQCHLSVYDEEMNPNPQGSTKCIGLEDYLEKRRADSRKDHSSPGPRKGRR